VSAKSALGRLTETLDEVLDRLDEVEFGISLLHVDTGYRYERNADSYYPLASIVKMPILFETLAQVDDALLDLGERIQLSAERKRLPSGILVALDDGLEPTLRDLLVLMVIVSDNTATDMVLERIGIASVERRLRRLGIDGISVKHTIDDLLRSTWDELPDARLPPPEIAAKLSHQPLRRDGLAMRRSPDNNVATPRALASLLARLVEGELLSASMTTTARDILVRHQLRDRIGRFISDEVAVAHKTGTYVGVRSDAGVVFLPNGTRLVIVAFAMFEPDSARDLVQSQARDEMIDIAIGAIAKEAFDVLASLESPRRCLPFAGPASP
jgi:beta-lactamase class A